MPKIRSLSRYSRLAFLIAIVMGAISANAQAQAEPASAPLIGAPVFAADGIKIGQVADVSVTTEGNIDAIRFFTGSALGFGERVVAVPQPALVISRGTVVLSDLSSADIEALPNASSENLGPHSKER